jgi:hypothetical protein
MLTASSYAVQRPAEPWRSIVANLAAAPEQPAHGMPMANCVCRWLAYCMPRGAGWMPRQKGRRGSVWGWPSSVFAVAGGRACSDWTTHHTARCTIPRQWTTCSWQGYAHFQKDDPEIRHGTRMADRRRNAPYPWPSGRVSREFYAFWHAADHISNDCSPSAYEGTTTAVE